MSGHHPAPGRPSRPWAATGGRVQDLAQDSDIRLDTQVTTRDDMATPPTGTGYLRIVTLCRTPRAVTELAAELDVPLAITAAMVARLRDDGHVLARAPLDAATNGVVTDALLRRVKDRLHAI
ncbi:DUF742 domain-containing protein [Streptomyces sp. NPDC054796]